MNRETMFNLSGPPLRTKLLRLSAAFLLALLAACTTNVEEPEDAISSTIWPSPPDLPRFAYEFTLRSAADIIQEREDVKLQKELLGTSPPTTPAMSKPDDVVARNGRIYVTDTAMRKITVWDIPGRKVYYMGVKKPGELTKPSALALDKNMNVYVCDVTERKVNVYDSLGLFLRSIGSQLDLDRPTGVAVSPEGDRIYVIDRSYNESMNHRVVVYDGQGNKLFVIGERGKGNGEFNVPVRGAVGPDGTLYILDAGNFRIQAFDRDGKFLRAWGKPGNNIGDLARPRSIAVDNDGNIYVTDGTFANIQLFNPQGDLLLTVASYSDTDGPALLKMPMGVAVDETGRIYVVDQFYNKIEVIRRLTQKEGEAILRKARK